MKVILTEKQKQKLEAFRTFFGKHPLVSDDIILEFCKVSQMPVYISPHQNSVLGITEYCVCPINTLIRFHTAKFRSVSVGFILFNSLIFCDEEKSTEDGEEVIQYKEVINNGG